MTKQSDVKHEWHVLDATDKILGRLATQISSLIIGKDNKIIDVNAPRPGDEAYEALKEISGM
jgi:large subunit ribosomal protein L13